MLHFMVAGGFLIHRDNPHVPTLQIKESKETIYDFVILHFLTL